MGEGGRVTIAELLDLERSSIRSFVVAELPEGGEEAGCSIDRGVRGKGCLDGGGTSDCTYLIISDLI